MTVAVAHLRAPEAAAARHPVAGRPLRVALVVPSRARKGPVLVAHDLARELVRAGHDPRVHWLDDTGELAFPCAGRRLSAVDLAPLRDVDVVHSHGLRPDAIAWYARNVARLPSVFVSTLHNDIDDDLRLTRGPLVSRVVSPVWRRLADGLDGCVVLSSHAERFYRDRGMRTALAVVRNGRPEHRPSPIDGDDAGRIAALRSRCTFLVGAHAVVTARKGFDLVVRSLAALDDWGFLLVGDGPEVEALQTLARRIGVAERFVVLGFRPNARDYLDAMDVYAMTSHSEGMPLALVEAAAAGVPAVCADIPALRETFSDDEVVFLAQRTPAAFAQALRRAHAARAGLAARARRRYARDYSTGTMAAGYVNVYEDLMGRRKR